MSNQREHFGQILLPHLNAAYNLAVWLLKNPADAEDAVQEAYLRALKHYAGFRGGDGRVWLLAIVRNVCYTQMQARGAEVPTLLTDDWHGQSEHESSACPEQMALQSADRQQLNQAIKDLPPEFREILVLREWEDLSYKDIAKIAGIPIGTVMSRLARARGLLRTALSQDFSVE